MPADGIVILLGFLRVDFPNTRAIVQIENKDGDVRAAPLLFLAEWHGTCIQTGRCKSFPVRRWYAEYDDPAQ